MEMKVTEELGSYWEVTGIGNITGENGGQRWMGSHWEMRGHKEM